MFLIFFLFVEFYIIMYDFVPYPNPWLREPRTDRCRKSLFKKGRELITIKIYFYGGYSITKFNKNNRIIENREKPHYMVLYIYIFSFFIFFHFIDFHNFIDFYR